MEDSGLLTLCQDKADVALLLKAQSLVGVMEETNKDTAKCPIPVTVRAI